MSRARSVLVLACCGAIGWAAAAHGQTPAAPSWEVRCSARLERARLDLARSVPWASRGRVSVTPTTWPGSLVDYSVDLPRRTVSGMIEDYPGATGAAAWTQAGRGECFDESEPPPDLHSVRNFDGRQAQIRIDGAGRRDRTAIFLALRAALEECATYR